MSEARLPFPLPHALAPLHVRRDGRDGRDGRSDADTAPTLVLLHAICTSGALWTPQLDAWRPAFRLLCVDLPGHGESAPLAGDATLADVADALAATLDAHGESRVTLVGTSWGSMVAQAFALRHPSRTASLVLAHAGSTTSAEGPRSGSVG
ncbi:alpha/beta fold hydrolase [Roseateles chitinivorans]|uniref:alpha/beta fold hydrolase n=1 Tax=Roseateles chitinivorans TaxID=2917965 RepID=UPI003D671A17